MAASLRVRMRMSQLEDLRRLFKQQFDGLAQHQAEAAAARIKERIYAQSFGHQRLSRQYRQWKVRHGLDPRILIATGAYVASIGARRQNKHTWLVSPAPGQSHNGRALSTIGLWLEYGTRRMPARPHYRPELLRTRQTLKAEAQRRMRQLTRSVIKAGVVLT